MSIYLLTDSPVCVILDMRGRYENVFHLKLVTHAMTENSIGDSSSLNQNQRG